MHYATERIRGFINRCAKRIDQELDPEANFWSQGEFLEYVNEGAREVWQAVREVHENWFIRELRSTDSKKNIGGRAYDPAELRLEIGRSTLKLPPDFRELVFLEGLPSQSPGDAFYPTVRFEHRSITDRKFREDALNRLPINTRSYLYEVLFGSDGAYVQLSPPTSLDAPIDVVINYIASPVVFRIDDSFEGSGFTVEMTDAILQYVLYQAAVKEKSEDLPAFERSWNLKRELSVRSAGPRQTRDEETVKGYLEDEL